MFKRSIIFVGIAIIVTIVTISCGSTGNTTSTGSSSTNSSRNTSGSSDLFTVKESVERDITGDITTYRMQIYNSGYQRNQIGNSAGITTFSLIKKTSGNIQVNQFEVMYVGNGWIFLENIQLKIDDQIHDFNINNPVRQTMGGSNVLEILSPVLSNEIVNSIKGCSSIIVQVNGRIRGQPISIDTNGISAINNFY